MSWGALGGLTPSAPAWGSLTPHPGGRFGHCSIKKKKKNQSQESIQRKDRRMGKGLDSEWRPLHFNNLMN